MEEELKNLVEEPAMIKILLKLLSEHNITTMEEFSNADVEDLLRPMRRKICSYQKIAKTKQEADLKRWLNTHKIPENFAAVLAAHGIESLDKVKENYCKLNWTTIDDWKHLIPNIPGRETKNIDQLRALIGFIDAIPSLMTRTDKSQAAHKRSLDFLKNIRLQNPYTVCFE